MRIVFMGTPDFAVPCLDVLIKEHEVLAVFTQPDRKKGRGKKIAMSPVKERALLDDISVYQPEKIKKSEDINTLKELSPDVIVVVAYGQILSQEILDIPKFGCINVHASLLPEYRGAAPINFAIVDNKKESGVTTMFMEKGLDTGDMIHKVAVDITSTMTAGELHDILCIKGSEVILKTLKSLEEDSCPREKQNDELSSYAPMMDKEMSIIDWNKTSISINALIRGFNPWPIATSTIKGEKIKIFESTITELTSTGKNGEIVDVNNEGIFVNCNDNILKITEIQMPNKKRMTVKNYILGNNIDKGLILGE